MEKTATLNLRVNPVVKQRAEEVLNVLGIPMSTAIDIYLNQISLTGGIPFAVTIPKVPASVSQNGLVHFKYNTQLKKSIRCKGGVLFGHPEVILPAYMKEPEFAPARELAAEWAEHAVKRKTAKNKAVIKDLVSRFWTLVEQILADRGDESLSSKGRLPPIKPQGKYHNLNDVLAAINSTYFEDKLTCRITWSNRVGGLSFHSVRQDPVTGEESVRTL